MGTSARAEGAGVALSVLLVGKGEQGWSGTPEGPGASPSGLTHSRPPQGGSQPRLQCTGHPGATLPFPRPRRHLTGDSQAALPL